MKTIDFHIDRVPVNKKFDLLVCGAGMAGITAAVTAARQGLKVGLIEYFGKPGGIPVTGLLGVVSGCTMEKEKVVDGFIKEVIDSVDKSNGVTAKWGGGIFDHEKLASVLLDLLAGANVKTYFYTQLISAVRDGSRAKYAIVASKSGIEAIEADIFIDATGDGDLAAFLGCPYEKGRDSDGLCQSSTLVFKVSGIDKKKALPCQELTKIWRLRSHEIPIDHVVLNYLPGNESYIDATVNMTHILKCDCMNNEDLSRVRFEGTSQAFKLLEIFRKEFPGFENAVISSTAEQIGVRETRRITGDYILTEDDVLNGRDFEDNIARCCWGIDVHCPDGIHTGIEICLEKSYGIPYRCITPKTIDNLYIAGRPISATHRAFSSSRINSTCMAIGQAAGLGAKLALESGSTRKINIKDLQKMLLRDGAIIDRTEQ